jgi:hypothetical protein
MCDVLYDCGGASASSSFSSTYNSLVSSTQNYISTNSTTSNMSVSAYQTAEIDIGGSAYPPCDISQTQSIDIKAQNGIEFGKNFHTRLAKLFNKYFAKCC